MLICVACRNGSVSAKLCMKSLEEGGIPVSGDVDVPVAKLSAELGASVGGSTTFTASESIQYNIPSRYKGRVIMRYYQDIFHFNWEKKLLGITVSSGSGSAWSNGRDPYYARQLISAY